MKYGDLRSFLAALEARGELKRVNEPIDPCLEITEVCDRTLRAAGPALLFERPKGHDVPVLANLFGTPRRGRARDGRGIHRCVTRDRRAARVPQGPRSAPGNARRLEVAPGLQARPRHGAAHGEIRAVARGDA